MPHICIKGKNPLFGEIDIQGAKNSALPILSASLLCGGESVIHNCPDISDIKAARDILEFLGCSVKRHEGTLVVDSSGFNCREVPEKLMREMRSSIIFLGALAAKCGSAFLSLPGGCELGPRPIDIHIRALEKMGMTIFQKNGRLDCFCEKGLEGCDILLPFPSVGATENIMLAAVKARGKTTINNAAKEPEISDLARFLNGCGANIHIDPITGKITVYGVKKLFGCEYTVIPDRIAAATYLSAVGACGGRVIINSVCPDHLVSVLCCFRRAGCNISADKNTVEIEVKERPQGFGRIRTGVYPAFPTDAQPALMAMATVCGGQTVFEENIFENRFTQSKALKKMGADIEVDKKVARVRGVPELIGADVDAADLRGGAALVIAGLCAAGKTRVGNVHFIKRGYENLVENLRSIGADITFEGTEKV